MEETIITFETSKLAKEKGFDILQHSYYFEDGEFKEHSITGTNGYYGEEYEFNLSEFNENWNNKWLTKKNGDRCFGCSKDKGYFETFSAPTQSLLQKWLREVHKINILYTVHQTNGNVITYDYCLHLPYGFQSTITPWSQLNYNTYEEALEIGLQEALKLIK